MADELWTRVSKKVEKKADDHDEFVAETIAHIGTSLARILDLNPKDPRVRAMLALVDEDDPSETLAKLGFGTAANDAGSTAPELSVMTGSKGYMPVFNADGTNAGFSKRPEEALALGFTYHHDDDKNVIGWEMPASPTAPTPVVSPEDRMVKVYDRRGKKLDEVTVKEGRADSSLEAKVTDDGTVERFVKKPRIVSGRDRVSR